MATRPEDEPSLAICAPLMRKLAPPQGAFDAAKGWKHSYGLYSLHVPASRTPVGTVTLEHTPQGGELSELRAVYDKVVSGKLRQVEELRVSYRRGGGLAEPSAWRVTTRFEGSEVPPGLEGDTSAEVRGERIAFKTVNGTRELPVPRPLTLHWLVYETVQRLAGAPGRSFDFTLIEYGDKLRPGARLRYRKAAELVLGGVKEDAPAQVYRKLERGTVYHPTLGKGDAGTGITMHAWDLTGRHLLPATLWTDAQGRLLVASCAMEVLLWQ